MGKEDKLELLLSEDNTEFDLILSYSKLSDFDRNGPKVLLNRTFPKNKGINMGSLIDDLLFSDETFKSKYLISSFSEPSSTLGVLCKIILQNYTEIPSLEEVFNIIERSELWKSTKKRELLQSNFDHKDFWGYLQEQYDLQDKTIITLSDKLLADEIVSILKDHEYSKHLFNSEMEHIYQYPFKYKYGDFILRGIMDILSIDHKNKIVYFKDLKTGAGVSSEFLTSYIKYRYYLQEAVYCLAFKEVCEEFKLEGYALAPFEFIYISLKEKLPIRYRVTDKWHNCALKGFKTSGGYHYKGIFELLDDIRFHWTNKVYDLPRHVYEQKGVVNLQDNFIEVV